MAAGRFLLFASRVREGHITRVRAGSSVPHQQWSVSCKAACAAAPCDKVTEIQRKNQQIRAVLKKLPWPELLCFEANGCVHDLPLRTRRRIPAAVLDAANDSRLRFLAGFFDGDGNVSCQSNLSGCYLQVSQSFNQAEILMLLRETFGGSIGLHSHGVGLQKPALRWAIYGQSARQTACLLAPHSITKQKQLLLAGQWPDAKFGREDSKAKLRNLKHADSAVPGQCTWEYLAGFFDAEGNIAQRGGGVSLKLTISQKYPMVLQCIREFLSSRSEAIDACLRMRAQHEYVLVVERFPECKRLLQRMLAAGLLCKAKQAELASGLRTDNAAQVHGELVRLTGNQRFGRSLDTADHERAQALRSLRRQARCLMRRGELHESKTKLPEIEAAQREHELCNALRENAQLLQYVQDIQNLHEISWVGPRTPSM
ncbi:Alkbh3 [Symbiodinium sp. CCMP2456]|nr:Alkbh3 [Symbiodinium sp. CCMP2456]